MYAAGADSRWKASCQKIIDDVGDGSTDFQIDVEALQELLFVYIRRQERVRGIRLVADLQNLFPGALPTTSRVVERARSLLQACDFLGSRDAFHAAFVLEHQLEGIVSIDPVFDRVPGLMRFDP